MARTSEYDERSRDRAPRLFEEAGVWHLGGQAVSARRCPSGQRRGCSGVARDAFPGATGASTVNSGRDSDREAVEIVAALSPGAGIQHRRIEEMSHAAELPAG